MDLRGPTSKEREGNGREGKGDGCIMAFGGMDAPGHSLNNVKVKIKSVKQNVSKCNTVIKL